MAEENTPKADATGRQPGEESDRQAQPVDDEQPPRLPFPVVGVGASAGGLEAFSEFLAVMRPDAGMAFVLVQHLPPDRESQMVEILTRRTAMPVAQVEDGMAVEPGRVYGICPGHILTIRDGRIRLGPALGAPRAANRSFLVCDLSQAKDGIIATLRASGIDPHPLSYVVESTATYHYPVIRRLAGQPCVLNPALVSEFKAREGHTAQEIIDAMGVPVERASDEKYKAVRKLRQHLATQES